MWELGYCAEGFCGKGHFDSVKDYKRRKWSRIHKVNHRNKKCVSKYYDKTQDEEDDK